jgi:hypothetical protein
MNDIQVADAGTQNYALDKCAMPADFGNREISGHLAVALDAVLLMVRSVSSRLEPRGPHFSSFETRPKGCSSSDNGEAVMQG